MLRERLDGVIVAVPTHLHLGIAQALLGKDDLKPRFFKESRARRVLKELAFAEPLVTKAFAKGRFCVFFFSSEQSALLSSELEVA